MGIFDSEYKIQKWKYKTDLIEVIIGNKERFTIPNERLTQLHIIEDFDNYVFPVFRINLVLSSKTYIKIVKNKDDVKFRIRIYKYFNYLNKVSEPYLNRIAIDDEFSLILDDDPEDMDSANREEESRGDYTKIEKDNTNDLMLVDNPVEFFLYKKDVAVGLKNQINNIFRQVTVTDVIGYFMKCLNLKNVLMSMPTNNEVYDTLIIPNMTVLEGIKFLDTYYGIYDVGSMIFFGFDYTYILRYDGKCSAYCRNEMKKVSIVIPKQTSSHIASSGVLDTGKDDNQSYVVAIYQTVGTRNDSISSDLLEGNNITVIENYSGEVENITNTAIGGGSTRSKLKLNKSENKYLAKTYVQQKKMNENVIELRISDYDIGLLRPNKTFNILFEDSKVTKKYDGNYMLCGVETSLIKEGENFVVSSVCKLKKSPQSYFSSF